MKLTEILSNVILLAVKRVDSVTEMVAKWSAVSVQHTVVTVGKYWRGCGTYPAQLARTKLFIGRYYLFYVNDVLLCLKSP